MQIGVDARLQHWDAPQFVDLRGLGVVIKGAGDQHIEARIGRLAGRGEQVRPGHRAELRADKNRRALSCLLRQGLGAALRLIRAGLTRGIAAGGLRGVPLAIHPFRADQFARPEGQRNKIDLAVLMGLLHARRLEIFQNDLREVPRAFALLGGWRGVQQFIVRVHHQGAMRRQTLDRKRPGHAHLFRVFVRLVVEVFKLGLGGDGGVDGFLPLDAPRPPLLVQGSGAGRPVILGLAGNLPFLPVLP